MEKRRRIKLAKTACILASLLCASKALEIQILDLRIGLSITKAHSLKMMIMKMVIVIVLPIVIIVMIIIVVILIVILIRSKCNNSSSSSSSSSTSDKNEARFRSMGIVPASAGRGPPIHRLNIYA